jgi:hypothetical protein
MSGKGEKNTTGRFSRFQIGVFAMKGKARLKIGFVLISKNHKFCTNKEINKHSVSTNKKVNETSVTSRREQRTEACDDSAEVGLNIPLGTACWTSVGVGHPCCSYMRTICRILRSAV